MDELIKDSICEVIYDITREEEMTSFKMYQKKYSFVGKIIRSIIFLGLTTFFFLNLYKEPNDVKNWALFGISLGFLIFIWIQPIMVRKNLLNAMEAIREDKYKFTLYNDRFSIQTVEFGKINEEEILEEDEEVLTPDKVAPLMYEFEQNGIEYIETNSVFIIFIKKYTYYTIPKRCIDDNTICIISQKFTEINKQFAKKMKKV